MSNWSTDEDRRRDAAFANWVMKWAGIGAFILAVLLGPRIYG